MADYERIMLSEFGLHHLRVPTALLVPGQVQIRRGGRPFGRFRLEDVFDGDFTGVGTSGPQRMADVERTSSETYAIDSTAKLSGPLSCLARVRGALGAAGASHVRITALSGELAELDEGALHRALGEASARTSGPLTGDDVAVVVVAVASVKELSVVFDDDRGARVEIGAAAAEGIAGEIGASTKRTSASGLAFSLDTAVPFAARVWRVERRLIGRRLSVGTFRGPVDLLGDALALDQEFVQAVGLEDGSLDLTS